MRAFLLAAGYGLRLRPYTLKVPKCLIEINGRPLLDIWLEKLSIAGIGPFLINTHYLHNQVENYIRQSKYHSRVTLSYESELLGTAGSLFKNISFFKGEDGILIHADNYCKEDLRMLIDAHNNRPKNCLMTMMLFRASDPSNCGIVQIDDNNVVIEFEEKPSFPTGNLANAAIYVLSREFLSLISCFPISMNDFSNQVIKHFLGRIYTFETKNTFIDIGTPDAYKIVNSLSKNSL